MQNGLMILVLKKVNYLFCGKEPIGWISQMVGSFDETIKATRQLLEVGIKPR